MYATHFMAVRRSVFEKVGGFRGEFDGSQDELIDAIEDMCDFEIDYTNENDGSLDVWATDATGEMIWRLCVTCRQQ
jgi:hypothetical protein